eukprot:COSAG02_NODE_34367_length_485_cov_0.803109_1_plen_69_part_00
MQLVRDAPDSVCHLIGDSATGTVLVLLLCTTIRILVYTVVVLAQYDRCGYDQSTNVVSKRIAFAPTFF